jgi:hypothetical protein
MEAGRDGGLFDFISSPHLRSTAFLAIYIEGVRLVMVIQFNTLRGAWETLNPLDQKDDIDARKLGLRARFISFACKLSLAETAWSDV